MIGQKTKFDKRDGVPSLQRCDVAFTEVFSKFTQSLVNRSTLRSYSKKLAKDLGGSLASTLDGMCVWKIVGFPGSYWKPTSPCPFLLERPVLGSSQRDGTSAADAMVEKIQFQKILKNPRLFVKNHSCIATFRPLPGSQQLPLVLQTTPLAPQVPPGSTPIDGGGILLFLDFRHFRPHVGLS